MSKGIDESAVLKLLAEGSDIAYAQIWQRYYSSVYRYALKFLGSRGEADEATQEVFLAVWVYRKKLADVENFDAYLFLVKRNVINLRLADLAKKHLAEREYSMLVAHNEDKADHRIRQQQISREYELALEALPPQQRKVYQMAKELDMTYDQIAASLNISPNTVKFHIKEVFKFLKQRLKAFASVALLLWLPY